MRYPPKQITAWSFSRYSVYDMCPAKAKFNFLDKIPEPPNEAMARGDAIHKQAEAYVKGEGRTVPADLKKVADQLKPLREMYKKKPDQIVVETTWAFRQDWSRTTWNDWAGCRVRIKVDVCFFPEAKTLKIRDWKTGKFRPEKNEEYMKQLELYALGGFKHYGPEVERVIPELVYTDLGTVYPDANHPGFTTADVPKLEKTWAHRTKAMLADKTFKPKPSNLCRWCHYRKENNGPCSY